MTRMNRRPTYLRVVDDSYEEDYPMWMKDPEQVRDYLRKHPEDMELLVHLNNVQITGQYLEDLMKGIYLSAGEHA